MGLVKLAGYAVILRPAEEALAIMRTKKAAKRRIHQEQRNGNDVYLAELYFTDGYLENPQ